MKRIYLSLLLVLIFFIAFSQTNHSGTISSNETWFAADNPHVVTSTVTVNAGIILTIEDGCEVRFNTANNLNIYGTLNAIGTSGNGILFTQNGTSQWGGLQFKAASSGTLEYCTVEYAT
ncbi:MAG: hypothetical protein K9H58_14820, partial [Bacteroidales bacterium]|nr:hypothetical protein [Bacteroidales bacterium]